MNRSLFVSNALTAACVTVALATDAYALPQATSATQIEVVESTENRAPALEKKPSLHFGKVQSSALTIRVEESTQYQTIDGFGASLTDSSAWLLDRKLAPEQRKETVEAAYDVKKLERVFHNLLLNACEAVSPITGQINIELFENQSEIEIRVSDNGRGIPAYLKQRVFEPFFTQGKANGTGLGLTVAQKIIEDHGGDLRLENSSAKGSTFVVVLPLGPREPKVNFGTSSTATVTP